MGAFRGGWQAENTMDGSFIAPLLHQHIWQHAHTIHAQPLVHSCISLSFSCNSLLNHIERTKIRFFRFPTVPSPRIVMGRLTLGTTSAPVHPLTTKLFVFQWVKPLHTAPGYQAHTQADVDETLSPRAGVCLGPRCWLIMAHYVALPLCCSVCWLFPFFFEDLFLYSHLLGVIAQWLFLI